jgi:hypothetical protein
MNLQVLTKFPAKMVNGELIKERSFERMIVGDKSLYLPRGSFSVVTQCSDEFLNSPISPNESQLALRIYGGGDAFIKGVKADITGSRTGFLKIEGAEDVRIFSPRRVYASKNKNVEILNAERTSIANLNEVDGSVCGTKHGNGIANCNGRNGVANCNSGNGISRNNGLKGETVGNGGYGEAGGNNINSSWGNQRYDANF